MSTPHVVYRVAAQPENGGGNYDSLDEALTALNGGDAPLYRMKYGLRGIRHVERRTAHGMWMRVQSPLERR